MNLNAVRIIKIVFSDIIFPNIMKNEELGILEGNENENNRIFKPYLQIFRHSEIVYNSLIHEKEVKTYRKSDISLWFNLDLNVIWLLLLFFIYL